MSLPSPEAGFDGCRVVFHGFPHRQCIPCSSGPPAPSLWKCMQQVVRNEIGVCVGERFVCQLWVSAYVERVPSRRVAGEAGATVGEEQP